MGTWQTEDTGHVICPTGVVLTYGERLTLYRKQASDDWFHYEHRAWRYVPPSSNEREEIGETLHAEYGFIRGLDDGDDRVEATFVMNSGRGEYAQGSITEHSSEIRLVLTSDQFINDRRGVSGTSRSYVFNIDTGICTKSMQLQTDVAWPDLKFHLEAKLVRTDPSL